MILNGLSGAGNILTYQVIDSDFAAVTCYHLVELDSDTTCIDSSLALGSVFAGR
jgi:hypothetical protein